MVDGRVQLRRIFRIVNGGTPTSDEQNWNGDVPWATPVDLAPVQGRQLTRTGRSLTEEGLRAGSAAVPSGSILVSTRAPIGYVARVEQATAFNQGCRGLLPLKPTDTRYFTYQLLALRPILESRGQGSTFVELSSEALASTPVHNPPQMEQRRIADFLDAETARIDALIAKKRQLIELVTQRLAAALMEQFAAAMGRSTTRLARIVNVFSGAGFPHEKQGLDAGEIPFLKVSDLRRTSNGRDINGSSNWVSKSTARVLGARLAPQGATLFPKVGAALLGNARRMTSQESAFDNNLMAVVPGPQCVPSFVYYWLCTVDLGRLANPGPVPSIDEYVVKGMRIPLVELAEQRAMVERMDRAKATADAVTQSLGRQIELLVERRQALITAATTGQLPLAA